MSLVIEVVLWFLAFLLTIWWCSVTILPVFYSLPKSISWYLKGWVEFKGIIHEGLLTPVVCNGTLFAAAFGTFFLVPWLDEYLLASPGWNFGQIFALLIFVGRILFSQSTHRDVWIDYSKQIEPYLTEVGRQQAPRYNPSE